jgi:2-(1,2-epoxy-1,2-dihydrophenyl)acetyl-CoA isomerase
LLTQRSIVITLPLVASLVLPAAYLYRTNIVRDPVKGRTTRIRGEEPMGSIEVTRNDGVVRVVLNNPGRMNAISETMFTEFVKLLEEMPSSKDRVLVVTGADGNFCSGADMASPAPGVNRLTRMRQVGDVALALQRLPQPTIAVIRGVAVGAGLNLALGCDMVAAASTARLSEIFVKRGLSLDCGGSWWLPRIVGMQQAKRLALLGEVIGAQEALDIGLVTAVVPDDELDALVERWVAALSAGPPVAMALTKAMLNQSMSSNLTEALVAEGWAQTINFTMEDAQEGRRAFAEKRAANFTGT